MRHNQRKEGKSTEAIPLERHSSMVLAGDRVTNEIKGVALMENIE
jgi:hypothetical protein